MAPTFFLKQFGLAQVSFTEHPHGKPLEEELQTKTDKPPKISPLHFVLDDATPKLVSDTPLRPSVKELSILLKLTKFWIHIKPIKAKPVLKRLVLRNIPADAEPIFNEPQCMDCHDDDDGCDHCELSHICDRVHVTGDTLMIAVAHPNALGEHAIGTFHRNGDTIYQWNGVEDIAIFLPLTNLDSNLQYRFVY